MIFMSLYSSHSFVNTVPLQQIGYTTEIICIIVSFFRSLPHSRGEGENVKHIPVITEVCMFTLPPVMWATYTLGCVYGTL